jgi:ribosome biogenesis GTPase
VRLKDLGWDQYFEARFREHAEAGLAPARVAAVQRGSYRVWLAEGDCDADLSGRIRHEADSPGDLPAVGDWVACRTRDDGATIHALLPRRGAFTRKVAGARAEEQVVAANVDTVFVVVGLDGDFNPRRVERYLALAREGGASPVVVLNKADLCPNLDAAVRDARAVAGASPVVTLAAAVGDVAPLEAWLRPRETAALLGSSGVGKSTITNALLGGERQKIGGVRARDKRGKHKTTHRELFLLPSGALLVDTPGMRELQLWGDEDSLDAVFDDVEAIARECRFTDCRHEGEPGCAVEAALDDGSLDARRLDSYRQLERELAHLATRRDRRLQLAEKQRWKAIHRAMRDHKKG